MKSFGAVSKGFQAIAVEMADYSKKAFEESTAATEKLFGAKSLDKAFEVQSDYVKSRLRGLRGAVDQARRALCRASRRRPTSRSRRMTKTTLK